METKKRRTIFLIIIVFVVVVSVLIFRWEKFSLGSPSQNENTQYIHGIVTQVEPGKDGSLVELETENGLFSVTISIIQAEIEGDFEQINIGSEIEVTGQLLDGMEPPLLVADKVPVLRNQELRK